MGNARQDDLGTTRFFMFVSTALFAYFGYFAGLTTTTTGGQYVLFYDILLWTLRIGATGFGAAFVLTFISAFTAEAVYALVGLGTSIGLVVVGIMDVLDEKFVAAIAPFWAFLFAAWNGYGSWISLRSLMQLRRDRAIEREPANVSIT